MQIWVDYAFWLEARKTRERKLKNIHVRGVTLVDIPEVETFDDPQGLVESYERAAKAYQVSRYHRPEPKTRVKVVERPGGMTIGPGSVPGKERLTFTRPGHDGRLWRPLMSDDFKQPMLVAHLADLGGNYSKNHPFVLKGRRDERDEDRASKWRPEYFQIPTLPTREQVMDMGVRETGKDGEGKVALRVENAARNLLIHQGTLWAVQKEPVYVVGMEAGKVVFELERPSSESKACGIAFAVNDLDAAREFAHELASRHGCRKPSDPYRTAVLSDGRYLSRDLAATTSAMAANGMFRLVRLNPSTWDEHHENPIVATLVGPRGRYATYFDYRSLKEIGDPLAFARDLEQVASQRNANRAGVLDDVIRPLELARELGILKEPDAVWDEDLAAIADFMSDERSPSP